MKLSNDLLTTGRAHALFASLLDASHHANHAEVAAEFGDHPDSAVARMLWVREVIAATYPCHALDGVAHLAA